MRFVTQDGSSLELNYMWLPTWIGQNSELKKEIEETLKPEVKGQKATPEFLDHIHRRVISIICEKYPLPGLYHYLDGIKFIEDE